MFNTKVRLALVLENTPIAIRFVPHNTDPTKVMIKGMGEAPAAFCQMAEISSGPLFQGSSFTMVEVDKAELAAGIVKLAMGVLENTLPSEVPAEKPVSCPECGCDDGTHFQFCGEHVKMLTN